MHFLMKELFDCPKGSACQFYSHAAATIEWPWPYPAESFMDVIYVY